MAQLRAIRAADGTPLYEVWQDKTHIVSGQNWWEQIVDGIIGSEVFLFMVSKESLQSPICAAELSYARKRNRPIVPIVLEGEFTYNTRSGKNDLAYWELIPQELNDMQAQLLFYEGASWVNRLQTALATFAAAPQRWADKRAEKPQDPRNANDASNNPATLYARACEAAEKLDINLADALFLKLVNGDSRYQQYASEWIDLLRIYDHLLRLEADRYLAFELPNEWAAYYQQFPKKFVALFDPKDFHSRFNGNAAEADRIAREKAEADRIAAQKAEQERLAREKTEADRIAREKAEQEHLAREKTEADRIARVAPGRALGLTDGDNRKGVKVSLNDSSLPVGSTLGDFAPLALRGHITLAYDIFRETAARIAAETGVHIVLITSIITYLVVCFALFAFFEHFLSQLDPGVTELFFVTMVYGSVISLTYFLCLGMATAKVPTGRSRYILIAGWYLCFGIPVFLNGLWFIILRGSL